MPCTNDLDTGEALALARDVDPAVSRTLTIVTKIDMRETHFVEQIKEMSEGLGVVCVRNRNAEELSKGIDFKQIRDLESQIWLDPTLQEIPRKSRGVGALVDQLVDLQRKMVLDYRYKFKEDLMKSLKDRESVLNNLPKPCIDDQDKQAQFKDNISNFQRDLEELSAGRYQRVAQHDREMRLRARLDELLKQHVVQCHESFRHFHSQEFYEKVEFIVKDDMGVHLPNHLDFTIAYQFITNLLSEIQFHCVDLIEEVMGLCIKTAQFIITQHFSRFVPVLELVLDKVEQEFEKIKANTVAELNDMIKIERSSIYLSPESQAEYERLLEMLSSANLKPEELMELNMTDFQIYNPGSSRNAFKVKQIKNSIHAYWLIASNRFIDQFHMWLLHNFVIEFKETFHRKLDQEYSPNAGTAMGEEIRDKMVEPLTILSKRRETFAVIKKLKTSLHDIDTINRM